MSLTSLLQANADIRDRFRLEFKTPPLERKDVIRAAPVTRNFSLNGVAFDYYMRFRVNQLNPQALDREWIAETALSYILEPEAYTKSEKIINTAQRNLADYLSGQDNNTAIIVSSLELATIDRTYRPGIGHDMIGVIDQGDVADMAALSGLIDDDLYTTKGIREAR